MKSTGRRKILSLDFDGTLHPYTAGWLGVDNIADEAPVAGAMDFIWEASKLFDIAIFSSRSSEESGRTAMKQYITRHFTEWAANRKDIGVFVDAFLSEISYPEHKPPAFVTIDGRAVRFNGIWPPPWTLDVLQPWHVKNKKD